MAFSPDTMIRETEGKLIDLDGFPADYPWQCHDLWLYELVSCGGEVWEGFAPGNGDTVNVWYEFGSIRPSLLKLFRRVEGTGGIQAGDVLFWRRGIWYPGSHTAMATGPVVGEMVPTLTQNPGPTKRANLITRDLVGYLRPLALDGASPANKGTNKVSSLSYQDRKARLIQPGAHTWLRRKNQKSDSQAHNVVGSPGTYSITAHVYAERMAPGDVLTVNLSRQNTKHAKPWEHASPHYTQRLIADKDGKIEGNFEFKLGTASGDMLFLAVKAAESNKKPARLTLVDTDSYRYL